MTLASNDPRYVKTDPFSVMSTKVTNEDIMQEAQQMCSD